MSVSSTVKFRARLRPVGDHTYVLPETTADGTPRLLRGGLYAPGVASIKAEDVCNLVAPAR